MSRTKGSKNKPKAKAKAETVIPRQPDAEATATGVATRLITDAKLRSLMQTCRSGDKKVSSLNGETREAIAFAVEKHHLHKGVFSTIRRLDKMEPPDLAMWFDTFLVYFDKSGLRARAESAPGLPMAEPEEAEGDEPETVPAQPANVSRPRFGQKPDAVGSAVEKITEDVA